MSYDVGTAYTIGDTIEANCLTNFEHSFENSTQTVRCTGEGWTRQEISECYAGNFAFFSLHSEGIRHVNFI